MRVDKWLWAARFFKTRSLASTAVDGGKIKINGAACKPAREVRVGDRVSIRTAEQQFEITVIGYCEQRRPASEARLLYEETADSQAERQRQAELRKLAPSPAPDQKGRPTKKDRRQLEGWLKG